MIKRILLPLDPSPFSACATELACRLAAHHQAEVCGLVILDLPGIEKSIGPVPLGASSHAERLKLQRKKDADSHVRQLLDSFHAMCHARGVRHSASTRQGLPSDQIIRESLYYDLVVMGLRTYFRFGAGDHPGDSLAEVLDHAVTPILAVPQRFAFNPEPESPLRVVLAFDGSLPAARTMQRLANLFAPDAMEVTVVVSSKDRNAAMAMAEDSAAFLRAHDVKEVSTCPTDQPISKAIDARIAEGVDVVGLGAHSRVRLLDFIVGSLTRHLIEKGQTPLFIGQ